MHLARATRLRRIGFGLVHPGTLADMAYMVRHLPSLREFRLSDHSVHFRAQPSRLRLQLSSPTLRAVSLLQVTGYPFKWVPDVPQLETADVAVDIGSGWTDKRWHALLALPCVRVITMKMLSPVHCAAVTRRMVYTAREYLSLESLNLSYGFWSLPDANDDDMEEMFVVLWSWICC